MLATWFESQIAKWPEARICVLDHSGASRAQRYAELWQRSASIAVGLEQSGVKPGDFVVLVLSSALDFVAAVWACVRAGFTIVPMNAVVSRRAEDLHRLRLNAALSLIDKPVVLTDGVSIETARQEAMRAKARLLLLTDIERPGGSHTALAPANPLILAATSGSTAVLKLAACSPEAIRRRYCPDEAELFRSGVLLSPFPFDGVTGFMLAFPTHGTWIHLPPAVFLRRPLCLLDAIEEFGVTRLHITNSLAAFLLETAENEHRSRDLSSLERVAVGAETVVPSVMCRLDALLVRHGAPNRIIRAGYGSTEAGALVVGADPLESLEDDVSSVGALRPDVEVRIVDAQGTCIADGEIGEIHIRRAPEIMFSGYWGDEAATRAGYTSESWWRTGDLGRLSMGELSVRGRLKEIIVVNGRKQSLGEIDAYLQAQLGVGVRAYSCAVHWPDTIHERLSVVFARLDSSGDPTAIAAAIRAHVGRRFALSVKPVVETAFDDLPLTSAGKIRRLELAAGVRTGRFGTDIDAVCFDECASAQSATTLHVGLIKVWVEALGLNAAPNPNASFFDLGGDSLKAAQLFSNVEALLGRSISTDQFFDTPTLLRLLSLAECNHEVFRAPADEIPWPLPSDLRSKQLRYFASWDGVRSTRDKLVAGLNITGSRAPLFWIFQDSREHRALAAQLGPEQPLYALRSGHLVMTYSEDEIQTLALRYAHEIIETRPTGPIFIGGNCQGAIIALATAQHLLRRRRYLPLLILMEWTFTLQSYNGSVLILYGRDSPATHPFRRFRDPERGWARSFAAFSEATIPGNHGEFFDPPNVAEFAEILTRELATAASEPASVPAVAISVQLSARNIPRALSAGGNALIEIEVVNTTPFVWSSMTSGLTVGSYWVNATDEIVRRVDGCAEIPRLQPGASATVELAVRAPSDTGIFNLLIGLVEDGSGWIAPPNTNLVRGRVTIVAP